MDNDVRRTHNFLETNKKVGRRIVWYMQKVKVSQAELAEKCFDNVKVQLVNRRLVGRTDLSIGEYMAICDYLGVPYDLFMSDDLYEGGKA